MRGPKGPWPLVALGTVGLVSLALLSEPGSRFITRVVGTHDQPATILGQASPGSATLTRVRGGRTERRDRGTDQSFEILDGDRFETPGDGDAVLVLSSQDEFSIAPKSVVALELWNPLVPNSPIYVHVLAGDVTSRRTGLRGRAYVVRNGQLFLPNQRPGVRTPPLVITRGTGTDLKTDADPSGPAAPPVDFETPLAPSEPAAHNDDPVTLANEYVEEMVASRQDQFQKCWITRLKDKPNLKGTLTVQFEINRRGKVRDVRATGSTLEDDQLANCVKTVVERLTFRPFTGPDVSFAYPITFE